MTDIQKESLRQFSLKRDRDNYFFTVDRATRTFYNAVCKLNSDIQLLIYYDFKFLKVVHSATLSHFEVILITVDRNKYVECQVSGVPRKKNGCKEEKNNILKVLQLHEYYNTLYA